MRRPRRKSHGRSFYGSAITLPDRARIQLSRSVRRSANCSNLSRDGASSGARQATASMLQRSARLRAVAKAPLSRTSATNWSRSRTVCSGSAEPSSSSRARTVLRCGPRRAHRTGNPQMPCSKSVPAGLPVRRGSLKSRQSSIPWKASPSLRAKRATASRSIRPAPSQASPGGKRRRPAGHRSFPGQPERRSLAPLTRRSDGRARAAGHQRSGPAPGPCSGRCGAHPAGRSGRRLGPGSSRQPRAPLEAPPAQPRWEPHGARRLRPLGRRGVRWPRGSSFHRHRSLENGSLRSIDGAELAT